MKMIYLILLVFISSFHLGHSQDETSADFYISPKGSDQWSGTLPEPNKNKTDGPFRTVQQAQIAVRELKQKHNRNTLVLIRGGLYSLKKTVTFNMQDSATKNATTTYAAYPKEKPIFSSGITIKDWNIAESNTPGLPNRSKNKVWVASLPKFIKNKKFYTLFDSKGLLPRARTKQGFIPDKKSSKTRLYIPEEHFKTWTNPSDIEIFVRPFHAWITNILPVKQLDNDSRLLTTSTPATYAMSELHFALKGHDSCWLENIIEELDEPGEWVVDHTQGKVYLWPREDKPHNIKIPLLRELFKIEGNVDKEGAIDTPVQHLHFRGLTFIHGDSYRIAKQDAGLQHDWDFLDKDNALVRFRGSENCSITQCHFTNSGGSAIRVDLHGKHNTVANNIINHIGGSGILLCGYGPGNKDVNTNNIVSNNHVHHIGKVYWHSPGIMLWQSGNNKITHNLIHHTPYTSMIISGFMHHFTSKPGLRELSQTIRWEEIGKARGTTISAEDIHPFLHTHDNTIEYNEIHNAMEKLADGNGIYIRGAGSNNIIRKNYVHHLVTPMIMQAAIRTDGGQRDTIISENIIYKCMAQGIMSKLNTKCENNFIIDVLGTERDYYIALREGPLTGGTLRNNIFYSTNKNHTFTHLLFPNSNKTEDRRGRGVAKIEDLNMDKNLYFSPSNPKSAAKYMKKNQTKDADRNSTIADPLFVDVENENFTLKPDSPALKLGIKQIDFSKIGLQK